MKILLLSPTPEKLIPIIEATGDEVVLLDETEGTTVKPDLAVSYNYRRIVRPDILAAWPHINLHISLLPYNRGADPNFWSWFDHTPKGVTIHYMDAGIDTGPIICQSMVWPEGSIKPTLRTFYETLHACMLHLFERQWPKIRLLSAGTPQTGGEHAYPTHRTKDKDPFFSTLPLGWDTPVSHVEEMGAEHHASEGFWRKYNELILVQRSNP